MSNLPDPVFYVWAVREPDGKEGPVSAIIPSLGPVPLVTMSEKHALGYMKIVAQSHANASGKPVRLLKFSNPEEIETI